MRNWNVIGIAALGLVAACSGPAGEQDNATDANLAAPLPGNDITAAPPGEPRALDAIPEAFRGSWNFAVEDCGDAGSEGKLTVAADRIEYYESVAEVAAVTSAREGAIVIEARFTGEGETWNERLAYTINGEGDRLTTTTEDGSESVRMRCPAG